MVQYIENLSDEAVTEPDIPTAVPRIYELDERLNCIRHYYLNL
ncbi:hypothetical protein [Mucilaginibacter humi]|nr:hypothetical protein [Mucilaginibacter humi]